MNLRSNRYYPSGNHRTVEIFTTNNDNDNVDEVTQLIPIKNAFINEQTTNDLIKNDDNESNIDEITTTSSSSLSPPKSTILIVTEKEINEIIDLNTNEIAEKVNKELKKMNIQRQLFGRHILQCGSTKLFNLLNRPKSWSEMSKHPKQYYEKMHSYLLLKKWLELPEKQRNDELIALNEWYLHLASNREQELCRPKPSLDRIRGERIKFTQIQINIMEEYFNENPYLDADKMNELVEKLKLIPQKINEWFHGRRKKWCQQHIDNKEMIENFRKKGRQYRNRRKQTAFDDEQIKYLEQTFQENPWLDNERRKNLAKKFNTDEQRIRSWFNNRRNKFKNDQLFITSTKLLMKQQQNDIKKNILINNYHEKQKEKQRIQMKRENCSLIIQKWYRGHLIRKLLEQQTIKFTLIRERLRFIQQHQQRKNFNQDLINIIINISKIIEEKFSSPIINNKILNSDNNNDLINLNQQIQNGCHLSIEIFNIINEFNYEKKLNEKNQIECELRKRIDIMNKQQQTMLMAFQN